jgi:predicted branched-subunit amino acid permease
LQLPGASNNSSFTHRSAFFAGFRAMLSPAIAIATWGLVTGVAMAKILSVPNAIGMSLLVFAGSAQLAALPLIAANLPLWTIFFTATVVNLRFIIFGAAIQPHFSHLPLARRLLLGYLNGDVNFVLFIQRYPAIHLSTEAANKSAASEPTNNGESTGPVDSSEREAYFYGLSCCNWLAWQGASVIGILLAQRIPAEWDVGFAGTLALLAIAIPLFADRAGIAAMLSAAVVSLFGLHWPYRLNLVAAVLTATIVGLLVDRLSSRSNLQIQKTADNRHTTRRLK